MCTKINTTTKKIANHRYTRGKTNSALASLAPAFIITFFHFCMKFPQTEYSPKQKRFSKKLNTIHPNKFITYLKYLAVIKHFSFNKIHLYSQSSTSLNLGEHYFSKAPRILVVSFNDEQFRISTFRKNFKARLRFVVSIRFSIELDAQLSFKKYEILFIKYAPI